MLSQIKDKYNKIVKFLDILKRYDVLLLVIFIFTLSIRLYAALIVPIPSDSDEYSYLLRAHNIYSGNIKPDRTHPLLISIVISAFYFIFGESYLLAKIIQAIIGALIIFPAFFLTRELFNEKIGLLCSLFLSVNAYLWYWVHIVASDQLFIFLFLWANYFILRGFDERKNWIYAGILSGLSFFARHNGILFLPVFILLFTLNEMIEFQKVRSIEFRNLIYFFIFLGTFFLSSLPKLVLRWYFFGDPFDFGRASAAMWSDTYYEALSAKEGSIWIYLSTHTPPQILSRLVLGVSEVLRSLILVSNPIIFGLGFLGFFFFVKRRYWVIHVNIVIWLIVSGWIYRTNPIPRALVLPIVPLVTILGSATLLWVLAGIKEIKFKIDLKRLFSFNISYQRMASLLIILFIFLSSLSQFVFFYLPEINKAKYETLEYYELSEWINNNTEENSVIMMDIGWGRRGYFITRNYAIRTMVDYPLGDLEDILEKIDEFNVNYLVIDTYATLNRPLLRQVYDGWKVPENFELVHTNYEGNIYTSQEELKIQVYFVR